MSFFIIYSGDHLLHVTKYYYICVYVIIDLFKIF